MKTRVSRFARAKRFAEKTFVLEKFVEDGRNTVVTPKLRTMIQNYISYGWQIGHTAGRADARKAAK